MIIQVIKKIKEMRFAIISMLTATMLTIAFSKMSSIVELSIDSSLENPDIGVRLEAMSESLSQYTDELESIQSELESRVIYVENLKKEAEIAESILELSEDQLNAVHSIISEELEINDNKNIWPNFLNNLFFCILGMVIPPVAKRLYEKFSKSKETTTLE